MFEGFKISAFSYSCYKCHTEKQRNGREILIHVEPQLQGLDLLVVPCSPPPAHRTRCFLVRYSDLASAPPSTGASRPLEEAERARWCYGKDKDCCRRLQERVPLCGLGKLWCVRPRSRSPVSLDSSRRRGVCFKLVVTCHQTGRDEGSSALGSGVLIRPQAVLEKRSQRRAQTRLAHVVKEANKLGRWRLG